MNDKIKTAIFVDVQNIYYTTRDTFARSLNYRKLWQQLSAEHDLVIAHAYAIAPNNDQQHKFQKALKHIGFDVKLKPYIQRSDGSAKGDWDVGITIDVMDKAREVDKVILLSGDGDFDLLVDKVVRDYQKVVEVISVETLTAKSLIDACSKHTPISQNLLQ